MWSVESGVLAVLCAFPTQYSFSMPPLFSLLGSIDFWDPVQGSVLLTFKGHDSYIMDCGAFLTRTTCVFTTAVGLANLTIVFASTSFLIRRATAGFSLRRQMHSPLETSADLQLDQAMSQSFARSAPKAAAGHSSPGASTCVGRISSLSPRDRQRAVFVATAVFSVHCPPFQLPSIFNSRK